MSSIDYFRRLTRHNQQEKEDNPIKTISDQFHLQPELRGRPEQQRAAKAWLAADGDFPSMRPLDVQSRPAEVNDGLHQEAPVAKRPRPCQTRGGKQLHCSSGAEWHHAQCLASCMAAV